MHRVFCAQSCEMIVPAVVLEQVRIGRVDVLEGEVGGAADTRAEHRHLDCATSRSAKVFVEVLRHPGGSPRHRKHHAPPVTSRSTPVTSHPGRPRRGPAAVIHPACRSTWDLTFPSMSNEPRIVPKPWLGWVICVVYAPIFIAVMVSSGVGYDEFTDSATNLRDAAVVPLAVVTVLLVIVITVLGWWRPVLRDHLGSPRIWRLIPVLFVVALLVGADYQRLGKLDTEFIMWAAVAAVLVGFAEEAAYRGVALVAFRSNYSEFRVWLFSTLLFMYLHAFNFFAGQDLGPTLVQLVFTFLMGSVLYAVRRATGTLIVPMVLHGAWDFVSFTAVSDAFKNPDELFDPRAFQPAVLILVLMIVLFAIGFKKAFRTDDPATPLSATATRS